MEGVELGSEFELDITGIAHGGITVGRHDGRVVFVTGAIPGERVRVRLTEAAKSSFWRADAVAVLEASPHRRDHIWPEAGIDGDPADRPGGAEFGHIALPHQRALKEQVIAEAFARQAKGVEVPTITVQPTPTETEDGTGWRTRVTLHVDEDGNVGPYAARSHRVVDVDGLPLLVPELEHFALHGEGDSSKRPERLSLLRTADGELVELIDDEGGDLVITERVGERTFRLAANGFWQVHREAPEVLSRAIKDILTGSAPNDFGHHLDLYGGVGLLGAAFLDAFGPQHLTTVEADRKASGFAKENLSRRLGRRSADPGAAPGEIEAVAAGVAGYLRRTLSMATERERDAFARGTIILDPPRSGAGKDVVRALAQLRPAQLVYVACDPVALARDVALFAEQGYRVVKAQAYDLFPNTHHVETVALLSR